MGSNVHGGISRSGSDDGFLQSSLLLDLDPNAWDSSIGFRVSSLAPIPEPSAYAAILGCLGLALALILHKRRRKITDC